MESDKQQTHYKKSSFWEWCEWEVETYLINCWKGDVKTSQKSDTFPYFAMTANDSGNDYANNRVLRLITQHVSLTIKSQAFIKKKNMLYQSTIRISLQNHDSFKFRNKLKFNSGYSLSDPFLYFHHTLNSFQCQTPQHLLNAVLRDKWEERRRTKILGETLQRVQEQFEVHCRQIG